MPMKTLAPVQEIGGQRVRITWHAAERALEMDVGADEIRGALANAEKVVESRSRPEIAYWTKGRITLAVAWDDYEPGVICVRTVLWSSAGRWATWFENNPDTSRSERGRHEWNKPREAV